MYVLDIILYDSRLHPYPSKYPDYHVKANDS